MPARRFSSRDGPFENQRLQVRPGGIDGGRPSGGAAADNNDFFDVLEYVMGLLVDDWTGMMAFIIGQAIIDVHPTIVVYA